MSTVTCPAKRFAMCLKEPLRAGAYVREKQVAIGSINNLDYVVLLRTDMSETRAFNRDVMGFALEMDQPNWVSFRVGSGLLTLRPRGPFRSWHDGPAAEGSASVQLAFRVPPSALDACYQKLQAAGVAMLAPPEELPAWRHRALFFRDPESNIIEIYAEV